MQFSRFWVTPAIFIIVTLMNFSISASYYDTLPKGRFMPIFRVINTSTISSSLNQNAKEEEYFFKVNLNSDTLRNVSEGIKGGLEVLKDSAPNAYNSLTLGEYEAEGNANVQVRAFAMAYGITNRITAYFSFPWWNAETNLEIREIRGNNLSSIQKNLKGTTLEGTVNGLNESINKAGGVGPIVQSIVENSYGYKPIGSWKATGPGDLELGLINRLTDWKDAGLAWQFGVVAPTGRVDDPDLLQDYGFGDGQWDLFTEFGGGKKIGKSGLSFDTAIRYTYQVQKTKELRIPEDPNLQLGSQKAYFKEKLGNVLSLSGGLNYEPLNFIGFSAVFTHSQKSADEYQSDFSQANEWLSQNTESSTQTLRAGLHLSTVKLFQTGKFFYPMKVNLYGEKVISGLNTIKYNRFDVELRLFF